METTNEPASITSANEPPPAQPVAEFLAPIQRDIEGQVERVDSRLTELRGSISDVQRQIAELETQRKTLLQMQQLASGKRSATRTKTTPGAATRSRLTPDERRRQIVELISRSPAGMKKSEIVEATGLSKIYVQNLLTQLRGEGKLSSRPSEAGDGSFVWSTSA